MWIQSAAVDIRTLLKCIVILHLAVAGDTVHVRGTFHLDDFFQFVIKFGFQKTERHIQRETFGYIYGNITSSYNYAHLVTFAVLEKYSFLEYYGNRSLNDKNLACQRMFESVSEYAYDAKCNPQAKVDLFRRIPCFHGKLCSDEDAPSIVLPGSQFTYAIKDLTEPRFWYISMVACYRNTTSCKWQYYDYRKWGNSSQAPTIDYDIYLVNGSPNQSASNLFTFHFSYDDQNLFEMYLIFFAVYLVLVPLECFAVRMQKHPVTKLFTMSLGLEFVSLCFTLTHCIQFAFTGESLDSFKTIGDVLDIFSRTSFMLILLLLAKGWAVTRLQISKTNWIILMSIWIPYCVFHVMLYVWNRMAIDIISDTDEYQTWPGWLMLACRTCIMLWFLYELRTTMKYEHSSKKLDFLLHFGASSLVWFIYLPVVSIVAQQISPMWRYKLLLGITNSADCLAYCVMTGLLWPNRSGQYLLLAAPNYAGLDELDEFNEAPHIVHGDVNNELPIDDLELNDDYDEEILYENDRHLTNDATTDDLIDCSNGDLVNGMNHMNTNHINGVNSASFNIIDDHYDIGKRNSTLR